MAITPKIKYGFTLASGPDNLKSYPEGSSQRFHKGDLVKLSANKVVSMGSANPYTANSTAVESGIMGVAARDANNDTANADCDVHVICQEQTWEAHVQAGKKPSTATKLQQGDGCKLAFKAATNYTISNGTTTTTTTVAAWYVKSTANTGTKGVRIVKHIPEEEGIKGGKVLVRFLSAAAQE